MTDDEITEEHIALMKDVLIQHVPHARALGMNVVNAKRSEAWLSVPYDEKLVGNPETGVIHGGVKPSCMFLSVNNNAVLGELKKTELDSARATH